MTTHWSIDQPWASVTASETSSQSASWRGLSTNHVGMHPKASTTYPLRSYLSTLSWKRSKRRSLIIHSLNQNKQASRQSRPDVETCFKTVGEHRGVENFPFQTVSWVNMPTPEEESIFTHQTCFCSQIHRKEVIADSPIFQSRAWLINTRVLGPRPGGLGID